MVSQTEVSRFICRSGEHKDDYYLICIKDGRLETQIIKKSKNLDYKVDGWW